MKSDKIEIRVSTDFKKKLKNAADEAGISVSEYVLFTLEHNHPVLLKDGAKIADQLMRLRQDFESKGLQANFSAQIRELVLKIDGLIGSFPQNGPDNSTDVIDCTFCEAEDEEFEEDGDII